MIQTYTEYVNILDQFVAKTTLGDRASVVERIRYRAASDMLRLMTQLINEDSIRPYVLDLLGLEDDV